MLIKTDFRPSHTKPAQAGHSLEQAVRRLDAASLSVLPLELLGALAATTIDQTDLFQGIVTIFHPLASRVGHRSRSGQALQTAGNCRISICSVPWS